MASFRIHEDQENTALGLRKDADVFSAANQRRALGDLSQFACHQNRNIKHVGLTNGPCKVQDENRTVRQIKNEKNIVPPVAQFRAFSVYEDKPTEVEVKKREPTFKPFVAKEIRKDNFFINAAENVKALCAQIEKKKELEQKKEAVPVRVPFQEKRDIGKENVLVESPMSVVDSSILSMSISKNESQVLEESETDSEEDKTIAQTDRDMFFHVVEYRQDIYDYMRKIEVKNRANPRYMRKQPDITHVMRSILIDWLVEVCDEYGQQSETLHLAVSYVDRFLSYMSVVRTKLQLVGTAATYIASKYEEVYPPEVSEFVYITDDTYTKREVLRMEHLILKVLSFDLSTPTALAFLSHFCITNGYPKKIFHLAAYIAELSLLEAEPYLQYKPSVIAAAALATARHCLLCERDSCHERDSDELVRQECADVAELSLLEAESYLQYKPSVIAAAALATARHCLLCERDSCHERDSDELVRQECADVAWPRALAAGAGYALAELAACARELSRSHAHAPLQPYRAIPDKYRNNKFDAVSTIAAKPMFPLVKYQPPAAARQPPPPEPKAS